MKSLTPTETSDLARLESVVEAGQQTFVSVGLALTEIRDRKLYRKDYETFEAYCQERWGWSRQRGSQLIKAASVVKQLPASLSTVVDNESQARELAKLPVETQKEVLREAKKSGEPLTAEKVKASAPPPPPPLPPAPKPAPPAPKQKPTPPPAMLDKTGYPIPQKLEPLWNRGLEVRALMSQISKVKCALEKAHKDGDPLYQFLYRGGSKAGIQSIVANLEQAYASLSACVPYAICLTCQGQATSSCTACGKTGIIGQFYYDNCVSQEVKDIRKKSTRL